MTPQDRLHLRYLAKATKPLWGGHLERGEPITDPDMPRWLAEGWITQIGNRGYVITDKGLRALQQTPGA